MNKNCFIATVHILVEANEHAEAADAISECLTGNLVYNKAIIDWGYISGNSEDGGLKNIGEINTEEYQEGSFYEKL